MDRALRKEERTLQNAANQRKGVVTSVYAHEADVETPLGIERTLRGTNSVAPGDNVTVGEIGDHPTVLSVELRRSKLSRPDVDNENKERLIVANVDIVVIVVSVVSPPLHPRLIDRYLVAIQNGGAKPVVCVNKLDLLDDHSELEVLEPYRQIGIPIILCSTKTSKGVDELRTLVEGQTVAFVGHSGVGKSSLANAFAPSLKLNTGDVSEGYGRGTHTTTVSSLHRLPNSTTLIDTPGIRSFGLWSTTKEEIEQSFPEFNGFTCRFRNCSHREEPGCGILGAVEGGQISPDRYHTFLRLREETG